MLILFIVTSTQKV